MAPQLRALALLADIGFSVPMNGSSQLPTPEFQGSLHRQPHTCGHTHMSKTGILSERELCGDLNKNGPNRFTLDA